MNLYGIIYTICLLTLLIGIVYIGKLVKKFLFFLSLPGPPVDWLLRHETDQRNDPIIEVIQFRRENVKKYPKLCRYFLGPFAYVSICDPDLIKHLIAHRPPKPSIYRIMLDKWIGDGLLTSNGRKWQKNRKLLTPAFHYTILSSFLPVYCRATHVMLQLWENLSANGTEIVIQEFTPYLTLDILMQSIGSLHTNCQVEREAIQYVKDVNTLTKISLQRFMNNLYKLDCYFYLTPTGRIYKQACKRSRAFTRDLIIQRRNQLMRNAPRNGNTDFLDILLTSTDHNGNRLSDQEICDEVDTFVFEGHDTTSSALSWILYYLTRYPQYQETCRNEIFRCFNEQELELQDLSKLEHLTMFIKETLRLCPPVFSIIREVDTPISIGGYVLPQGTFIEISIISVQTDVKVWSDPLKFDPMRFSKENINEIPQYSYLPFSVGERNCIGQVFAMNELKVVCSLILKKYKLEFQEKLLEPEELVERDVIFKPAIPIKLRLIPVNPSV